MQGLRVVLDVVIAGLRNTVENSTGTGPTRRAPLPEKSAQLGSAHAIVKLFEYLGEFRIKLRIETS